MDGKRRKCLKVISLFQIILMIGFIFAFSFILNSNFVRADATGCEKNQELVKEECVCIDNNQKVDKVTGKCVEIPHPSITREDETQVTETPDQPPADSATPFPADREDIENMFGVGVGGTDGDKDDEGETVDDENGGDETSIDDTSKFLLLGPIFESFKFALLVVAGIQLLGPLFGLSEENTNALSQSAAVGIIVEGIATGIAQKFPENNIAKFLGKHSTWIGVGAGVLIFVLTYKKEKQETIIFSCLPWQAPTGGSDCEKCNNKDFPCSEYQCRSLGQSCELINRGTQEEKCVWINRNDVNPPIIQAWEDALLNDYKYAPDNAVSPPDRGVKILYEKSPDNCVPAFTPLKFGVTLNEPAICKLDVLRKDNFNEMALFMS
ncbi:hypothetical protein LCGC14_2423310, partial [marine sediment metagenome]